MVLGIDRLKTLSEVIHNWKEQSMHFKRERWVELKTSSSTMYPPVSLKVWSAKQTGGLWGQMGAVTEGSPMPAWNNSLNPTKQQQQSCAMLETYAEIFTGPQGLPPTRLYDHSINLLPNQGPVSVRPYRYPYVQKEEIKDTGDARKKDNSAHWKRLLQSNNSGEEEGSVLEDVY